MKMKPHFVEYGSVGKVKKSSKTTTIVVFAFTLMFTYYWKLALVMVIVIPLYATVYWITNRLNKKVQRKLMEKSADLESQLVESLNSVETIKRFGLEPFANLKTETRFISLLQSVYHSGMNTIFSGNASEFLSRLFTIVLLWVGTGYVIQNQITPGELLSFYSLIGYLTGPVTSLIGMNKTVQDARIAADRLFEIFDLEHEEEQNKLKLEKDMLGNIRFEKVHFRYGSRTTVFEGLDLVIPKGEVTAVVGESGSGKTTITSLLQKLYHLQKGHIFIGDYNLEHISTESLREIVAVVPQKIDLFAGNVVENIAVGQFEPDMKKIVGICSQLGILEFIENLPNGFGTFLGENGATLSGGQKQRLAIARALYQEPELLILDEATSSLDSASESYVQKAVNLLREKGKTVILIAHRLSTVLHAHRIIVLEKGKVIEEGKHQNLIEAHGAYYQLWK